MQQPETINPLKSQRSMTIQLLRGIAILCVVLAHTCPRGMLAIFVRPCLNSSVPLFIFLSGYLTRIEGRNWPALFKKRILRVLIPYLIWTVLYAIQKGRIDKLDFYLLTASSAGHLYYIFVYVQLVLLTPVLAMLAKSKYRNFVWVISPIFVSFYVYAPLFTGAPIEGYPYIIYSNICLGYILYYYLGLLLGNHIIVRKYNVTALAVFFAATVLLQIGEAFILMRQGIADPGNPGITNVLTSALCCLLIYAMLERGGLKRCNTFLVQLGNYSFGLYLSHMLVKRLLQMTTFYDSLPYLVNTALVLVISLAICYVGDKLLGARISRWLGFR